MTDPGPLTAISMISGAFLFSWAGVRLFRAWSLRRNLLDVPNERSSHSQPTPRGGGLVIAVAGLIGYALIAWIFETPFSVGYLAGAGIVAFVSWLDDLYSIPFWARLIVHVVAASVLVTDLGVWQTLPLPFTDASVAIGPYVGTGVTIIWVVWFLNAYNFMDGIDGIAGLQAVIACLAWTAVGLALDLTGTAIFAASLAAISFGFLIHNWQPARIFMGDVGSAFLGFSLAAIPLLARHESTTEVQTLPLVAILFVWLFVFDTVFTFFRRAINREPVWKAHRSHVYQRMVIGGMPHWAVTALYGLGATLLSTFVLLSVFFAGIYSFLAVFLLLALTFLQVYFGSRKKSLT